MNNQFDELTKSMAQSVTRRAALKKFGIGLACMALAGFGLANKAKATGCAKYQGSCVTNSDCCSGYCFQGACRCVKHKDCKGTKTPTCFFGNCIRGSAF